MAESVIKRPADLRIQVRSIAGSTSTTVAFNSIQCIVFAQRNTSAVTTARSAYLCTYSNNSGLIVSPIVESEDAKLQFTLSSDKQLITITNLETSYLFTTILQG